jgi:glycosyltransferase involved in cell wall biosynthesis
MTRLYALTPTWKPVGGVIKILDYSRHALDLGYEVILVGPPIEPGIPLFEIERFQPLAPGGSVDHVEPSGFGAEPDDFVFFSWPTDYETLVHRLTPGTLHERVIHIVQNVRHANPSWIGGYALRLLTRPMARIMVAEEVLEACLPWLNRGSPTEVIPEGHDWAYFSRQRQGGLETPAKVGFTTWKSVVGLEVAAALAHDPRFEFRSIGETVGWKELRELYHWADIFLACPNQEEGFYLPGLEALAAGALLVTPDVGGNRAYCRFGENSVLVEYESAPDYVAALIRLAESPPEPVDAMRQAGYGVLSEHTLDEEKRRFGEFLDKLHNLPH